MLGITHFQRMKNVFIKTQKCGKFVFQTWILNIQRQKTHIPIIWKNVLIKGIRFDFQTWLVASFHAWNEQLRNVENSQNGIFQIKTMNPTYNKNTYNN